MKLLTLFNSARSIHKAFYICLLYFSGIVLAGCTAHLVGVKNEPQSFANYIGLPYCMVSVPLSPSEVIEHAKDSGNPNPEENSEWINMVAALQSGDQIRKVNCSGAYSHGYSGASVFYALFRNNMIVLKFHPMLLD